MILASSMPTRPCKQAHRPKLRLNFQIKMVATPTEQIEVGYEVSKYDEILLVLVYAYDCFVSRWYSWSFGSESRDSEAGRDASRQHAITDA